MKNIFILTAHDGNTNSFVGTFHYSNLKAASGSFDALKEHLIEKYSLQGQPVERWSFSSGGAHKTDIIGGRFNVTLNQWNVSKEVSEFIKD